MKPMSLSCLFATVFPTSKTVPWEGGWSNGQDAGYDVSASHGSFIQYLALVPDSSFLLLPMLGSSNDNSRDWFAANHM